jgi:hypothetical protein
MGEMGVPALFLSFKRKLRAVTELTSFNIESLRNEIIQGSSQIVDDLTDENGRDWWKLPELRPGWDRIRVGGFLAISPPITLRGRYHHIGGVSAQEHFGGKTGEFLFELHNLIPCPAYSRSGIIEGFLDAIGVSRE